jgi:ferredoxin
MRNTGNLCMPKKYNIKVSPALPRFPPIGKFVIDRGEDCINCGRCALSCVYGVHKRQDEDPRRMAEPVDYRCKGCYQCIQECLKEALIIRNNRDYHLLGDTYWTPEIIAKNWYQAETGKIPVSGAGYTGPFAGEGFDSMWTDMSEIVRPTRDGIHGREYISTSVDIGRKVSVLAFDAHGALGKPRLPTLSIPLPIIFDTLPFGNHKSVYEAMAIAASHLGILMIADPDVWTGQNYRTSIVPLIIQPSKKFSRNISRSEFGDVVKTSKMTELESERDILHIVKEAKRISPETIISVRVPFDDAVEEVVDQLAFAGVEVVHLYADINGGIRTPSSEPCFIKDMILKVHRHLVDLKIRDEVTLIVSGGIAIAEHVAKSIICGADVIAIDLPLLIALECRYCKNCLDGSPCPVALKDVDPHWAARRIINLIGAWRNQLLEVLGAMGLREVRRLRGEVGRAIFFEDIEKETFETVFCEGGAIG